MLTQYQILRVFQVKLKAFFFRSFFFLKGKMYFFVWEFQISMFAGSCSEDCGFCIEQFERGEISNK